MRDGMNGVKSPAVNEFPAWPPGRTGWPWTRGQAAVGAWRPDKDRLPRISVVMPSFNQGSFIEAAIRSVLLQGYEDLELIVVDGGSTDETVEILRKYEPWLTFWVSEPDAGQADALYKGFARSTGEVLAWLNSDDMYCPGALDAVGLCYRQHPDSGLVYGDCEVIDAEGVVTDTIRGEAGDLERLLTRNIVPQPSAFFSRRAFDRAGGIDSGLHFIMDYELWIRMMLRGEVFRYLPVCLSRFRWYRVSKSGSYSTQFGYEYLSLLRRLLEEQTDERLRRTRLPAFHYAFTMIMACNGQGADDEDIQRALGLWERHLDQYEEDYRRFPALLADSLCRMGDAYCLQGNTKKGRAFFGRSLRVGSNLRNPALPGGLISCMGPGIYRRYAAICRALASQIRRRR